MHAGDGRVDPGPSAVLPCGDDPTLAVCGAGQGERVCKTLIPVALGVEPRDPLEHHAVLNT